MIRHYRFYLNSSRDESGYVFIGNYTIQPLVALLDVLVENETTSKILVIGEDHEQNMDEVVFLYWGNNKEDYEKFKRVYVPDALKNLESPLVKHLCKNPTENKSPKK